MLILPPLCPYTSPRYDDTTQNGNSGALGAGAARAAAAAGQVPSPGSADNPQQTGQRMDISSLLPQSGAPPVADLTATNVTTESVGGGDPSQQGAHQPQPPQPQQPQPSAEVPSSADNAEASAAAAAAIVEAAARSPEPTAFEVPVAAIRQTVERFDFIGSDLLPQLTEIMGGDASVAQQFATIMNGVLRNAVGDNMVFAAELSQRHSQHLMGQQQALTQDQQLRAAISEHMPEGATAIQVNGAIATAKALRGTNPNLGIAQLAQISAQLSGSGQQTGTRQPEALDYNTNREMQLSEMRRAFQLPTT